MGYGSRALDALNSFYSGELLSVDENERIEPEYPDLAAVDAVCFCRHIFIPVHSDIS